MHPAHYVVVSGQFFFSCLVCGLLEKENKYIRLNHQPSASMLQFIAIINYCMPMMQ
jgi:hypothetical protein